MSRNQSCSDWWEHFVAVAAVNGCFDWQAGAAQACCGAARSGENRTVSTGLQFVPGRLANPAGPAAPGVSPRAAPVRHLHRLFAVAALVATTGCGPSNTAGEAPLAAAEWHEFQGTWTAAGDRHTIRLGSDRRASIANLNGTLLLAGSVRPGLGFRAEAIVLNDSVSGMVGRAVWTDERGDQVYSELRGEGTATGNRIHGTLLGGTGRYSGATGSYEFSWRFVLEAEDGSVQGQSVGLKGRVRAGAPATAPGTGGQRP